MHVPPVPATLVAERKRRLAGLNLERVKEGHAVLTFGIVLAGLVSSETIQDVVAPVHLLPSGCSVAAAWLDL